MWIGLVCGDEAIVIDYAVFVGPQRPAIPVPVEDWRQPFDEFEAIVTRHQAEAGIVSVSDADLVALVHKAR